MENDIWRQQPSFWYSASHSNAVSVWWCLHYQFHYSTWFVTVCPLMQPLKKQSLHMIAIPENSLASYIRAPRSSQIETASLHREYLPTGIADQEKHSSVDTENRTSVYDRQTKHLTCNREKLFEQNNYPWHNGM